MSKLNIVVIVLAGVLSLSLFFGPSTVHGDENLHQLKGTLTACWCDYYPGTGDWLCWANFSVTAPSQYFADDPTTVLVEIRGQALGQCSTLQNSLPESNVRMLFWLEAAGTDYVHGVIRSPVKGYYLIDE